MQDAPKKMITMEDMQYTDNINDVYIDLGNYDDMENFIDEEWETTRVSKFFNFCGIKFCWML
jgi:hypothetical protein